MSTRAPHKYSIDRVPFLPSHKRYDLKLLPRSEPDAPVYVHAIPSSEIEGYIIDRDEDANFNLSSAIGNDNGSLIWGRAGFETSLENLRIETDPETENRMLLGDYINTSGAIERSVGLNLDNYLDIIEYLDEESREVLRKLGEKPTASKRSIVLCFDGTSNHFSNQNTNVVKLVELLKKNDPNKQVVYYQTGVGTYAPPGMLTNVGLNIAAKADEGVAWFLYQHVIDGYKYLMQTYQAGDQISIFGFSRGAYTARALAGMIHSVGLLPMHNVGNTFFSEHVPFAYQVYEAADDEVQNEEKAPTESATSKRTSDANNTRKSSRPENVNPADFKRAFCIPIEIHFLGVWDTVGSVGAFKRKALPFIEYNPSVHIFRQALALDENRGNFIPSMWDHARTDKGYQNALEVWFKGGHADVGGGTDSPKGANNLGTKLLSRPLLSNITLRWMIRQCLEYSGVLFDPESMRRYRLAGILEPRVPGKDNEARQALVDPLDALDITPNPYIALDDSPWRSPWWTILEYMPVPKLSQLGKRTQPETVYSPNACSPRSINLDAIGDQIRLHCSVVSYLETETTYVPQATWHVKDKEQWPEIDEGLMSSIISEGDQGLSGVIKKLRREWPKPKAESWFKPFAWFQGGASK